MNKVLSILLLTMLVALLFIPSLVAAVPLDIGPPSMVALSDEVVRPAPEIFQSPSIASLDLSIGQFDVAFLTSTDMHYELTYSVQNHVNEAAPGVLQAMVTTLLICPLMALTPA